MNFSLYHHTIVTISLINNIIKTVQVVLNHASLNDVRRTCWEQTTQITSQIHTRSSKNTDFTWFTMATSTEHDAWFHYEEENPGQQITRVTQPFPLSPSSQSLLSSLVAFLLSSLLGSDLPCLDLDLNWETPLISSYFFFYFVDQQRNIVVSHCCVRWSTRWKDDLGVGCPSAQCACSFSLETTQNLHRCCLPMRLQRELLDWREPPFPILGSAPAVSMKP